MHDETYVRFVYAHSKSDGRHHDLQIVALKFFLHIDANSVFQPRMIGRRANAATLQARSGIFHFRPAVTVDDTRFAALLLNIAH